LTEGLRGTFVSISPKADANTQLPAAQSLSHLALLIRVFDKTAKAVLSGCNIAVCGFRRKKRSQYVFLPL